MIIAGSVLDLDRLLSVVGQDVVMCLLSMYVVQSLIQQAFIMCGCMYRVIAAAHACPFCILRTHTMGMFSRPLHPEGSGVQI